MSRNVTASPYDRTQVPEPERCKFTSTHGRRCTNPHNSNANKFCIIHQRHIEKIEDAELRAVSDQLFSGGPELRTREELGRVMAQLFTLIAQKRVSRHDGALLAYVASLLLQTMLPTTAPANLPVRVVWDIPMGEPSEEEAQRHERQQNSNPQFPNGT